MSLITLKILLYRMIIMTENELVNHLSKVLFTLKVAHRDQIPEYPVTERHFEVGDIAYVCCHDDSAEEVVITHVDDHSHDKDGHPISGGIVYYWYRPVEQPPWYIRFYYTLEYFWIVEIKMRFGLHKGGYHPPSHLGPGHGETAGRHGVLFRTKEEAELDYAILSAKVHIERIIGLIQSDKG